MRHLILFLDDGDETKDIKPANKNSFLSEISPLISNSNEQEYDAEMLQIDIDLKYGNILDPTVEAGGASNNDDNVFGVEGNTTEEESRNPKRRKIPTISPIPENMQFDITIEPEVSPSGCVKDHQVENMDIQTKGTLEEEQLDSDDDSEIPQNSKPQNTTFSQVEDVIELDSDNEDPAYESWCSSQNLLASTIKKELISNDDNESILSLDSPSRSSMKDEDFPDPFHLELDESDDDVIFLECDNRHLDLEGSQMALFEKIRNNMKVKKEKIESQDYLSQIDIVNLASPPRKSEEHAEIPPSSPDSPDQNTLDTDAKDWIIQDDDEANNKKDERLIFSPSPVENIKISSPYSLSDDLPDIDIPPFVDNQRDQSVKKSDSSTTSCPSISGDGKDPKNAVTNSLKVLSSHRRTQLIDPLPSKPSSKLSQKYYDSTFSNVRKKNDHLSHEKRHEQKLESKSLGHTPDGIASPRNIYRSVSCPDQGKQRRAEALKEVELKKKVESEVGRLHNTSKQHIEKPSAAGSEKVKTSLPKIARLLPKMQSLKEVDLFGDDSSGLPRQPIRRAHTPKHSLSRSTCTNIRKIHNKTSTTSTMPAQKSTNMESAAGHQIRRTAETTFDR